MQQNEETTHELELVRASELRAARVIEQIERELPALQLLGPLFAALRQLAASSMMAGPSIQGPAWKEIHDLCSLALGEAPAGTAVAVSGRPAMVAPRFQAPPARNGAQPAWPGQGTEGPAPVAVPTPAQPSGAAVSTVPIPDIRKREDVAQEVQRIAATLHAGGVPPTGAAE